MAFQNLEGNCSSNGTSTTTPMTCAALSTWAAPSENSRCAQSIADSVRWQEYQDSSCGGRRLRDAWLQRLGTLGRWCSRAVVVFDSNESAQLFDATERQRLREQISRVWCTTPWLSHAIVTRVLFPKSLRPRASTPVDTGAYSSLSHDESDTAFCLRDQNLKSPPLWTSIPPHTERLSSRFASQSLSVYAMILSDRTPHR